MLLEWPVLSKSLLSLFSRLSEQKHLETNKSDTTIKEQVEKILMKKTS